MRNVFIFLGVLAILVIGWMLWISTPDADGTTEVDNQVREELPEEVSLVGKTVCLSDGMADQGGACTFGFITSSGVNYLLDTKNMQSGLPAHFMDSDIAQDGVRISGTVVESNTASAFGAVGLLRGLFIEPASSNAVEEEDSGSEVEGAEFGDAAESQE